MDEKMDPLRLLLEEGAKNAYSRQWHRIERGLRLNRIRLFIEEIASEYAMDKEEKEQLFLSGDPILHNGIYYCPVDLTRTDTSDDYHWEEIDPTQGGQFCWRTFYQCQPYRLSPPASERLEPFSCREVLEHLMTLTTG